MSQYVNFFIRHNNAFLTIADYSRSSALYGVMQDAPYEKLREYSYEELQLKINELNTSKAAYRKQIDYYNNHINLICEMDNSIEDKLETITSIDEVIKEIQQEIDTIDRQAIELDFIANLVYQGYRIYAGVEVGEPTLQDIVEK